MKLFFQFCTAAAFFLCMGCAHTRPVALSPDQLVRIADAGAPALPCFVYAKTPLTKINQMLKDAGARVTLEAAYQAAFEAVFETLPPDGNTGQGFTTMKTASHYLRAILKDQGVEDFHNYLITTVETAIPDGVILIAAVRRPRGCRDGISVFNKFNFLARETLSPDDPAFFRAYRMDVDHAPLDTILDWAALPVECISYQGYQAVLLTLMANRILANRPDTGYWQQERQWISGDHLSVLMEQDIKISQRLGLEQGVIRQQKKFFP